MRSQVVDDEEEEQRPRQRQRLAEPESDDGEEEEDDNEQAESADGQLIKRLVRYAMACDFNRAAIRRDGIREKGAPPKYYLVGHTCDLTAV